MSLGSYTIAIFIHCQQSELIPRVVFRFMPKNGSSKKFLMNRRCRSFTGTFTCGLRTLLVFLIKIGKKIVLQEKKNSLSVEFSKFIIFTPSTRPALLKLWSARHLWSSRSVLVVLQQNTEEN